MVMDEDEAVVKFCEFKKSGKRTWKSVLGLGNGKGASVVLGGEGEDEGCCGFDPLLWGWVVGGVGAEAGLEHGGIDDARVESDGGEAFGEFLSESGGETFDGVFGGAVSGDFWGGGASPTGAEVDDDAGAALDHGWEEVAEDVGYTFDVGIEDSVGFAGGELPEWGVACDDGGVVDEDVWGWAFFEAMVCPAVDVCVVADIDFGKEVGEGVEVGELVNFAEVAAATADDVAEGDEFLGECAAEAFGAAGDDDAFHWEEMEGGIGRGVKWAICGVEPSAVGLGVCIGG